MVEIIFKELVDGLKAALKNALEEKDGEKRRKFVGEKTGPFDPGRWAVYIYDTSREFSTAVTGVDKVESIEAKLGLSEHEDMGYKFPIDFKHINDLLEKNIQEKNIRVEGYKDKTQFTVIDKQNEDKQIEDKQDEDKQDDARNNESKQTDSNGVPPPPPPMPEGGQPAYKKFAINIGDKAWEGKDFYALVTHCLYPFVAYPLITPLQPDAAPWNSDFNSIKPTIDKGYVWTFRGDDRKPEVIFKEGFKRKIEVKTQNKCRQAISSEIELLEKKSANPVWFRFQQEDCCTETGISMGPDLASAAVFPFIKRNIDDKNQCSNIPPNLEFHQRQGRTGRKKPTILQKTPESMISYVYGIKSEINKTRDTAYIQRRFSDPRGAKPYPEIATSNVPPEAIRFAIQLRRWPKSQEKASNGENLLEGWAVLESLWVRGRRQKDWPKDAKDAKIHIGLGQYKDRVLHYKWTADRGYLEPCSIKRRCEKCKEKSEKKE